MLDKPVLHVYFIYEHIFICLHVDDSKKVNVFWSFNNQETT